MVEVVSVWAPRPENEKWRDDYLAMLAMQQESAERVGHRHILVTDDPSPPEGLCILHPMQQSLMHAILEGQLAYVSHHWTGENPLVVLDLDCLIMQSLEGVFAKGTGIAGGAFNILLTVRENPISPVQNGAMYFSAGSKAHAVSFFSRALASCESHWGGDQEALSRAAAPIGAPHTMHQRHGAWIAFESTDSLNHTTKKRIPKRTRARYVAHFKGNAKQFMRPFFDKLMRVPPT